MRALLYTTLLCLSGCSTLFGDTFSDRSDDYLQARPTPDTQVPEGSKPLAVQDTMPIPELAVVPAAPAHFEVPRPAPLLDEDDSDSDSASLTQYQSEALNPRLDQDGAGTQILRLDSGYAQSWARVTEAIAATDLTLTDLNRSTGTFFLELEVADTESEQGFWSSLFNRRAENEIKVYLLKMNRAHSGVYLSLLTDSDNLAGTEVTNNVLSEILRQLQS